jgi:hypothetical protein
MPDQPALAFEQALGVLRQFRGVRRSSSRVERCELCSGELNHDHPHLVELVSRQILCACDACALLFDGTERSKFKRVSRSIRFLPEFQMTDAQWNNLVIPINLAFFFHSSIEGRIVALYPSPAGAVESLLPLDSWNATVEKNPVLGHLQSDIEALLINRIDRKEEGVPARYYIAPIDECYKLVGILRSHWKGLSGGAEAWEEIERFFSDLDARSERVGGFDA